MAHHRPLAFLLLFSLAVAGASDQENPVREKVRVDVVRVPLWARDRTGLPVTDLTRSELQLTVDGRPVEIETIESEGQAGSVPPLPPNPSDATGTSVAPPGGTHDRREPPNPVLPFDTFILIDESTAGMRERRDSFDELDRFVAASTAPRRVLVATFRRGRIQVQCPWTEDRQAIRRVLAGMRRHPYVEQDRRFLVTNRPELSEFVLVRNRLLAALLEALADFPDRPARRQLVFVTGGRTFASPIATANLADGGATRSGNVGDSEYSYETPRREPLSPAEESRDGFQLWARAVGAAEGGLSDRDVVAKAIERNVVLIPIDAVQGETLADIGKKSLSASPKRSVIGSQLEAARALKSIGMDTGGDLIPRPSAAARDLGSFDRRVEIAITFHDPFEGDRRFHRVDLKCDRPGVALSFRSGYRIPGDDERILDGVLSGFQAPPATVGTMRLEGSISSSEPSEGRPITRLRLRLSPPRGASDTADRAIDVIAVGRSTDGGSTAPVRWSGKVGISADGGFEAVVLLKIPPAGFTWSVAVRDAATGLVDYAIVDPPK